MPDRFRLSAPSSGSDHDHFHIYSGPEILPVLYRTTIDEIALFAETARRLRKKIFLRTLEVIAYLPLSYFVFHNVENTGILTIMKVATGVMLVMWTFLLMIYILRFRDVRLKKDGDIVGFTEKIKLVIDRGNAEPEMQSVLDEAMSRKMIEKVT